MNVRDVLATKPSVVITVTPSETIGALSRLLREKRIGAAVVTSNGHTIEGVITERDIAYGLGIHAEEMHALPVSALMTKTVITCSPTDSIAHVASTMLARNIRHLPVEDGNRLVGMVSIRDVLKTRVDELQQQTAQLHLLANKSDRAVEDRG